MDVGKSSHHLDVIVLRNRTRRNESKLQRLASLINKKGHGVYTTELENLETYVQLCNSWICVISDDLVLDADRLDASLDEFWQVCSVWDILLPHKFDDRCDLGSMLSNGNLYVQKVIHSIKGAVVHRYLVDVFLKYFKHQAGDVGDACGFAKSHWDCLGMVYPRSMIETSNVEIDCTDGLVHSHGSLLDEVIYSPEIGIPDPVCPFKRIRYYTVYPNVVQSDSNYARLKEDMRYNECTWNVSDKYLSMTELFNLCRGPVHLPVCHIVRSS